MADFFDIDAERHKRGPAFATYSSVAEAIEVALDMHMNEKPIEDVRAALEAALVALNGRAA